MKKILILEPDLDQARSIAKFLKCYSNTFFIVGGFIDGKNSPRSLSFFDKLVKVPSDFVFEEEYYDMIVPTGTRSTSMLLSNRKSIQIGNISFNQNNLQVLDKIPFLEMVEKLQIPIPKIYKNIDEINEFPLFYKQRFEKGRGIRGIINNKSELEALSEEKSIFFQEYIDSVGNYDVGFLAKDGIIITSFMHNALYNYPKSGGSGVVLTRYFNKKLLEYSHKILKKLNYSGWGLIQFKYCPKRKDFVIMEFNAKFWASVELTLLNNPAFLKELFGISYEPKKIHCIVFLNRLAYYGIYEYVKISLTYLSCYRLYFWDSIIILCGNAIPERVKKIMTIILTLK